MNDFTIHHSDTFINKCLRNEALIEDIDEYINQWHKSTSTLGYLHHYLGMSSEEYCLYLEEKQSLKDIIINIIFSNIHNEELSIFKKLFYIESIEYFVKYDKDLIIKKINESINIIANKHALLFLQEIKNNIDKNNNETYIHKYENYCETCGICLDCYAKDKCLDGNKHINLEDNIKKLCNLTNKTGAFTCDDKFGHHGWHRTETGTAWAQGYPKDKDLYTKEQRDQQEKESGRIFNGD